jgi:N-acetylmuramoyl-L-alanine amidase
LKIRTDRANNWGADIYISFHHNANTGKWGTWTGTETYTYIGNWPQAEKLAKCVHAQLVKAYGLVDRGLKKEDFHIVRESTMPAILLEGGYMDSSDDIKKLRDNNVLRAAGYAAATGVAQYAGLKMKAQSVKTEASYVAKPSPEQTAYEKEMTDAIDFLKWKGVITKDLRNEQSSMGRLYLMLYRYYNNVIKPNEQK